jgi:hypothetical protein
MPAVLAEPAASEMAAVVAMAAVATAAAAFP